MSLWEGGRPGGGPCGPPVPHDSPHMTSSSRMRVLMLLSIVIGIAGCGSSGSGVTPGGSNTPGSIAPSSSSVAAGESPEGSAPASTASATTGDWGPLAVVAPSDGADTARNEGILRITESCVVLVAHGEQTLLVWPADRTSWRAEASEVEFLNFDGSLVSVGDGTRVEIGGSGESFEESGLSVEAWLARTPWVARPASSCQSDAYWFVGAVNATS